MRRTERHRRRSSTSATPSRLGEHIRTFLQHRPPFENYAFGSFTNGYSFIQGMFLWLRGEGAGGAGQPRPYQLHPAAPQLLADAPRYPTMDDATVAAFEAWQLGELAELEADSRAYLHLVDSISEALGIHVEQAPDEESGEPIFIWYRREDAQGNIAVGVFGTEADALIHAVSCGGRYPHHITADEAAPG